MAVDPGVTFQLLATIYHWNLAILLILTHRQTVVSLKYCPAPARTLLLLFNRDTDVTLKS